MKKEKKLKVSNKRLVEAQEDPPQDKSIRHKEELDIREPMLMILLEVVAISCSKLANQNKSQVQAELNHQAVEVD